MSSVEQTYLNWVTWNQKQRKKESNVRKNKNWWLELIYS